ncbi:MAG: glycosyltransferase [Anaerolineae bacterium]|nr:glycosyltransferase [Anaerolineae bacterium]
MPRVTVVIPTFNRAHLIDETLETVFSQTYRDFEIIVVDDGSTDNTLEHLTQYDNKIRVFSLSHQGQAGSYARNEGIKQARGEYIAFLDSDDLWLPKKLEYQMRAIDAENSAYTWVYSDAEAFDHETSKRLYRQSKNHHLYEGMVLEKLFLSNFISSITPVIHRSVFDKVGLFWPTPKLTDWDMMLRIAADYPIKLIPDVLARFRLHQARVTESLSGKQAYEAGLAVLDRALNRHPERLSPLKNRALTQLCLSTGRMLARDGHLGEARQMFTQAIQFTPTNPVLYFYWLGSLLGGSVLRPAIKVRRQIRHWRSMM